MKTITLDDSSLRAHSRMISANLINRPHRTGQLLRGASVEYLHRSVDLLCANDPRALETEKIIRPAGSTALTLLASRRIPAGGGLVVAGKARILARRP